MMLGKVPQSPSPFGLLALLAVAGCSIGRADERRVAPPPDAAASPADTAAPAPPEPAAVVASADAGAEEARRSAPKGDRIFSKARFAWIQPAPKWSKGWLGYLGLGGSVAVRGGTLSGARVPGSGSCPAWYAVEPAGYVCAGDAATTDAKDPVVAELSADAPKTDSPWPYEYAESLGAPRYRHVPSREDQQHEEWDFGEHEKLLRDARGGTTVDKLAGVDLGPASAGRWGEPPSPTTLNELSPLVRDGRKWIALGSTVAMTRSFDFDGRTFLVTHDHAFVPKDRVKPYPRSEFHGVELGAAASLPFAFIRKKERPKYHRSADGSYAATGEMWPRLALVMLTGDEAKEGDKKYLLTREPGVWILAADAAVVHKAEPPAVVKEMTSERKTWVDVSVLGGTLVAYEGERPVFATLISPGRGGVPAPGKDPLETASTPTGIYRVDGKFVTATMVSSTNDDFVHTEVQYVQNFHGPHALHGAYWHDAWGEPKSGGCVNLSPIDARWLFAWSEPPMPEDWYGLRSVKAMGPATVVVIHK
jgi:hypothetical protein